MKIEEIKKLNIERTQGAWEVRYISDDRETWCEIIKEGSSALISDSIDFEFNAFNAQFISSSPVIIEQYIKARRFKVTEEFIQKVDELLSTWQYEHPKTICKAVLEAMWEMVEGEDDARVN